MLLDNGPDPAVKRAILGTKLQQKLGSYSPTLLALLGHEMQTGEVALTQTTPRQTVAVIPKITMSLLLTVRRATALEYAAMKRGDFTVEALHKEELANQRMSDAELKQIMVREGLDRVLALLDELTRPAAKTTNGDATGHANDNNDSSGTVMPVQLLSL